MFLFVYRSYKNGYVWNDVGENDVIYPSEGAEYVLKGSELIEGCTGNCSFISKLRVWMSFQNCLNLVQKNAIFQRAYY